MCQAAVASECQKQSGWLAGPVVPTAEIAKSIYSAVASAPALHRLEGSGPISVIDEGDKWAVTHSQAPKYGRSPDGKNETVEVSVGGGHLAMEIDKCTGAVSMSLSR
jgi:hypothetical protein